MDRVAAGIYFGYSNDPNGLSHSYYQMSFNDRAEEDVRNPKTGERENAVKLMAQVHREPTMEQHSNWASSYYLFEPACRPPYTYPWRKMAVVVKPDAFDLFWEGNCIEHITNEKLKAKFMNHRFPAFAFENWSPANVSRKPLGLYVYRGAASFRSVIRQEFRARSLRSLLLQRP